jgi:photosystem II stability/assembly factor-like uncharacterized protein
LPTARPPVLASPAVSADGKLVYAVGSWFEDGVQQNGLFRSSDLGMSWCVLPAMPDSPAQVAPSAGDVIYATSEQDARTGARKMLKSSDGGATWTVETSPDTDASSIIVSPVDPAVVWSVSGDAVPQLSVSKDGMHTWSEVPLPPPVAALDTPPNGSGVVLGDPGSPVRLFLTALFYPPPNDPTPVVRQRFFATDDAGTTWREITAPAASDPSLTATLVADRTSSLFMEIGGMLFVSNDWGNAWTSVGPMPSPDASLRGELEPPAAGALFAGLPDASTLWRSTDGGGSWQSLAKPLSFQPWVAPDANSIVGQVGSSVVATHDGGAHWQSGPPVPVGGEGPSDGSGTLVGSQVPPFTLWWPSNGVCSQDGGVTWQPLSLPGPGRIVPSGASAREAVWIAADSSEMRRTEDAGTTWVPVTLDAAATGVYGVAACPPPGSCLYVVYGNTSLSCGTMINRSDDFGRTWGTGVPQNVFCSPTALKVAPDDDRHVVGTEGQLVETRDGGKTWTSRALDWGSAGDVAVLGNGVLIVASDFREPLSATYRSSDGGTTWTQVRPNNGTFFQSPQRPGEVYLLEGDGLYLSKDQGVTWTNIAPGSGANYLGIGALADAPGGKLVGSTGEGLVTVEVP